jgi:hypothetical protein
MEQSADLRRDWADATKPEDIAEIIECLQPFYFEYGGREYLIEAMGSLRDDSLRFIIVDPAPYYDDGGWPEKHDFAYPGHLEAKTPDEMKALAFLDGKTIFERFNELRFFNW